MRTNLNNRSDILLKQGKNPYRGQRIALHVRLTEDLATRLERVRQDMIAKSRTVPTISYVIEEELRKHFGMSR